MTVTLPTQEQVDAIAKEFAPDVLYIRFRMETDHYGDPSAVFRIMLSDERISRKPLRSFLEKVEDRLNEQFHLYEFELHPSFSIRGVGEHRAIKLKSFKDELWDPPTNSFS